MKYNKLDEQNDIKTKIKNSLSMMDKEQIEDLVVELAMNHRYSRTYIIKSTNHTNTQELRGVKQSIWGALFKRNKAFYKVPCHRH